MRNLLRRSKHHVTNGSCADFFWIAHQDFGKARRRNTSDVVEMFHQIAQRWPYWNRTAGRNHILHSPCDHGPKDCLYGSQKYGGAEYEQIPGSKPPRFREVKGGLYVPHAIAPKSPNRTLAFMALNGDPSTASHRRGLDIRLPSPEGHTCGPFCGMSLKTRENHSYATTLLRRLSPWTTTRAPSETDAMLRAARPHLLFFAGRAPGVRGALFKAHANRSGFVLHDSSRRHASVDDAAARSEVDWMPRMFASSTFCFSPLGTNEGDSDRYLPAILYGCIPIFVNSDVPPFADVIDWGPISARIEAANLPCLHEVLGDYSHEQIVAMRQSMRGVWQKLLWTSVLKQGLSGRPKGASDGATIPLDSYLGEDGKDDAFATLLAVLLSRMQSP